MGPKEANLSNKFIVTSKIFVSVLPDSHTLVPDKLVSINESDVPSTVYLLDTPEDDNSWFKYTKVAKTAELFEEACNLYPKYWKVYYRHALYHVYKKDTTKAFEVFNHGLSEVNDFDLHLKYLIFLYHTASIHEYIGSLVSALDRAGMDYRSEFLWREWTMILVKIYNCNLLALGMTSGLLPDLFTQDQNLLKTPLVPTETEQLVYRSVNSLDTSNRTYLQMYGEVNSLRNVFQKWMKTPTHNMRCMWDAYSAFENTVDTTGTLSSKLLGDMKGVINLSMRAYERITELFSKVYPIKPASYEGTVSSPTNTAEALGYWMEIIKYEESNPMGIPNQSLVERVLFAFERALCPLVFCREMWYRYFQFLLYANMREQAISQVTLALNKYLKEDDKLRFVLALYLEESGDMDKAEEEFVNLVAPGFKTSEMDHAQKGEFKLRKLLECKDYQSNERSELDGLIHYLNFVRREMGMEEWREQLQLTLSKSDLNSWDLYWYAASTELRCFRDYDRAIQILKQAQSKMAFSLKYTMLFFNTMINVGKHNDVRLLLSELVLGSMDKSNKMTENDREELWNFWMNTEYLYGNQETFDNVKNLYMASVIGNKLNMDPFTERSSSNTESKVFALYSDVVEAFEKTASTTKRQAAQDFGSIVNSRRKLFCSGVDFEHLDKIFKFNLYQGLEVKSDDGEQEQVSGVEVKEHKEEKSKESTEPQTKVYNEKEQEEVQEKQTKKDTKKNKSKKGKTNQTQTEENKEDKDNKDNKEKENREYKTKEKENKDNKYELDDYVTMIKYGTKISRPNVSRLSEIEPKMTTSLESLIQLHGSKRPILPPKFRPLDSTGTPCKALFDFIRILPSSKDNKFSNLYVNTESVDYLIRTVENMDLGNISVDQYEPLPTNLSTQLKQTDETLNEKSFEFNQGLENILHYLQDNALFEQDRPAKRQKIAI